MATALEALAPAKASDDGKFVQVQIGGDGVALYVPASVDLSTLASQSALAAEAAARASADSTEATARSSAVTAEALARSTADINRARLTAFKHAMKDVASSLQAPGIIPTFTLGPQGVGSSLASQIAGAILDPPQDANGLADGTPFRYTGAYGLAYGTSGVDITQIRPRLLTGSALALPTYGIRFGCSGVTTIGIKFKMLSGLTFRWRDNDRWMTDGETPMLAGTAGSLYELIVSGLDTGHHIYQLDVPGSFWFGGIFHTPQAKLWKPHGPGLKAVLLSDSTGGGAGVGDADGATGVGVWWQRCCDLLGWEPYNASIGGTGMIDPGAAVPFTDRVAADVTAVGADVIVISGSRNDHIYSQSAVQTAATALYAQVRAANPNALIIVIGSWIGKDRAAAFIDANTAVRTAALAAGLPYIDIYTGQTYDPSGTIIVKDSEWVNGTGDRSAPIGLARHRYNALNTGANGAVITPANSGGGSADIGVTSVNDAFDSVLGTPTYDTSQFFRGESSMNVGVTGPNMACYITSDATVYGRAYFRFPTTQPANTKIAQGDCDVNPNVFRLNVVGTTMKLNLTINAGVAVLSTNSIPLNQWVRIEWIFSLSGTTATITVKLFLDPDGTVADETLVQSGADTDLLIRKVDIGGANATFQTFNVAQIEVNNVAYPGRIQDAVFSKAGNADYILRTDKVHPSMEGHKYWARRANNSIRAIIGSFSGIPT